LQSNSSNPPSVHHLKLKNITVNSRAQTVSLSSFQEKRFRNFAKSIQTSLTLAFLLDQTIDVTILHYHHGSTTATISNNNDSDSSNNDNHNNNDQNNRNDNVLLMPLTIKPPESFFFLLK
jgi:hypothetical protein